ncbi:hypothetical protein OB987_26395 [Bacillus cereus]|nr:hypothetical protein [Bacillus cereus]
MKKLKIAVLTGIFATSIATSAFAASLSFSETSTELEKSSSLITAVGTTVGGSGTGYAKAYTETYINGVYYTSDDSGKVNGKVATTRAKVAYGKGKVTAKTDHRIWDASGEKSISDVSRATW